VILSEPERQTDPDMTASPIAFSPGSVTGFFLPVFGPTKEETVSRGLSFCLNLGVTAAMRPAARHQVILNGEPVKIAPVLQVLNELAPEPVTAILETPLPLGCGFGVSAAATLGTAFVLNRRFELGRSVEQLAMLAHGAEVSHLTGIGDVAAQVSGGVVYRRCRSGPFDTVRLDHVSAPDLSYICFGPLSTSQVLNSPSITAAIASAGTRAVDWLDSHWRSVSMNALFDRSLQFAEESRLLTSLSVRKAIQRVRDAGGSATMVMLGKTVLAAAPAPKDEGWTACRIDPQGARLIS
jgi:pantoate kinase